MHRHRSPRGVAWPAAYAAVMGLLCVLYFAVPGPVSATVISTVLTMMPAIAIMVGLRLHRPDRRRPWGLLALQQMINTVGTGLMVGQEQLGGRRIGIPTPADIPLLLVYPFLILGLLGLVKARTPGRDKASLLDACMVTVSLGALSWVFVISPSVYGAGLSVPARLVGVAYPLMDIMMLAILARFVLDRGSRPVAYTTFGLSVVLTLTCDSLMVLARVDGTWRTNSPLVDGYVAAGVLLGASALHPSMRRLTEPAPAGTAKVSRVRIGALLALATLVIPLLITVQMIIGQRTDVVAVVSVSVALSGLAMMRMSILVQDLRRVMRQNEWWAQRETILREAAAALVAAVDPTRIAAITGEAARALAAGSAPTVSTLDAGDLADLPPLTTGPVTLAGPAAQPHGSVLLVPMLVQGDVTGVLQVATARPLPPHVGEAVRTLAAQAALALESVALAANLHRSQNEERFRRLVQHSSDVITVVDHDLVVRYQTPSTEQVLGYASDELLGTSLLELIHPDDRPLVAAAIAGVLAERSVEPTLECRIRRTDGRYVRTETIPAFAGDDVQGCVLTTRDITERKALEEQLNHQAFHDPVTGLANRALFVDRTHHALDRRRAVDTPLAVLFLDLDDFKAVNDSLGHEAGDQLLATVGRRLSSGMRPSDTLARIGGDEFAILLEDLGDETEATRIAERLLATLVTPIRLGMQDVPAPASVGIALVDPDRVPRAEDLLRDAEAAMYIAKQQGKSGYACFAPGMHEALVRKLEFTAELRTAVARDEFAVLFQPIVELADGRVCGVEALVRWQHPTRGTVSPLDFIPIAEKTGLIVPIGRWVLQESCRQGVAWQSATGRPFKINVNLSVRQMQEPGFVADVVRILDQTGLPPQALCLEITETFLADEETDGTELLCELKRVGVQLAIDDFGTGYSSLSRLQQFPLDTLKIPKPFVDGIALGTERSALARAIADLAVTLRLEVVAEGIETADQWAELRRLGCRYGQGFHFARPMPADRIDALLAEPGRSLAPMPASDRV